jgi:DNA polymerase-3 subunit epsilon
LAAQAGFFYDNHSAVQDCYAALELLKRPPPRLTRPAIAHLLERARRTSYRIWAENSPFDLRELLKARGYRWNGDPTGTPRSWYIDVDVDQIDEEMRFLRTEIYLGDITLTVTKITAFDRFSGRV